MLKERKYMLPVCGQPRSPTLIDIFPCHSKGWKRTYLATKGELM